MKCATKQKIKLMSVEELERATNVSHTYQTWLLSEDTVRSHILPSNL